MKNTKISKYKQWNWVSVSQTTERVCVSVFQFNQTALRNTQTTHILVPPISVGVCFSSNTRFQPCFFNVFGFWSSFMWVSQFSVWDSCPREGKLHFFGSKSSDHDIFYIGTRNFFFFLFFLNKVIIISTQTMCKNFSIISILN